MYKILIADDELIIRKGLAKIIDWNGIGFEIAGDAANGKAALAFIEEHNPDVVLMDIRMPVLSGLEVIKAAREKGFKGEAVILSGFSDFEYAQEAINYGVRSYLTKPVEKQKLHDLFVSIKEKLDATNASNATKELYTTHSRDSLLAKFITKELAPSEVLYDNLNMKADCYQIVIFDKFSFHAEDMSYNFSELLRVSNTGMNAYESFQIKDKNVLILKGSRIVEKFGDILAKYDSENPPEKNSPLDTIFFACGEVVDDYSLLPDSFTSTLSLLERRFYIEENRHYIEYDDPVSANAIDTSSSKKLTISEFAEPIVSHIQAFNRDNLAYDQANLRTKLSHAPMTIADEKNFLFDLYLEVRERIRIIYRSTEIPFVPNQDVISKLATSFYLNECLRYLSEQYEMIMSSIGFSSRDSIIDSIAHYIDYNYADNISLESIAPLFGYNSSYLGKIFSKKMGINFNTYLDNVRITHSKELLLQNNLQVYKIAELVGYRNVDYFHIKFKKSTGMSPAEFRKTNKE